MYLRSKAIQKEEIKALPIATRSPRSLDGKKIHNKIAPVTRESESPANMDFNNSRKEKSILQFDERGFHVRINPSLITKESIKTHKAASVYSDRFSQIMSHYN